MFFQSRFRQLLSLTARFVLPAIQAPQIRSSWFRLAESLLCSMAYQRIFLLLWCFLWWILGLALHLLYPPPAGARPSVALGGLFPCLCLFLLLLHSALSWLQCLCRHSSSATRASCGIPRQAPARC